MNEPLRFCALGLLVLVCGLTAYLALGGWHSDALLAVDQLLIFLEAAFLLPIWWLNEHDKRWKLLAAALAVPAITFGVLALLFGS